MKSKQKFSFILLIPVLLMAFTISACRLSGSQGVVSSQNESTQAPAQLSTSTGSSSTSADTQGDQVINLLNQLDQANQKGDTLNDLPGQ